MACLAHRCVMLQPPISRDLVKMIRDISKKDARGLADGLRAIEERQSKEIEFYLRACALRLESCE